MKPLRKNPKICRDCDADRGWAYGRHLCELCWDAKSGYALKTALVPANCRRYLEHLVLNQKQSEVPDATTEKEP